MPDHSLTISGEAEEGLWALDFASSPGRQLLALHDCDRTGAGLALVGAISK